MFWVRFIGKRLLIGMGTLLAISTITFFLMKSVPGDPFSEEQCMPPEILEALRSHYGLNDSLLVQYGRYLQSLVKFDLGPSLKFPGQTINQIICAGFPISATLGLEALFLAIPLGLILGTIAAKKAHTSQNMLYLCLSVLGVSIPSFVVAAGLQFLLALKIPLFPVARWSTWNHTFLPAIALAFSPACYISRIFRSSLLDIFNQQYIHTAKLKGLSASHIMCFHVWKNALLPILTYLGPVVTNILVGSFIIERVFCIPGLGQWFVTGVINRDYPVIGGLIFFYSILLLCNHMIIDCLYVFLDPRITFNKKQQT